MIRTTRGEGCQSAKTRFTALLIVEQADCQFGCPETFQLLWSDFVSLFLGTCARPQRSHKAYSGPPVCHAKQIMKTPPGFVNFSVTMTAWHVAESHKIAPSHCAAGGPVSYRGAFLFFPLWENDDFLESPVTNDTKGASERSCSYASLSPASLN